MLRLALVSLMAAAAAPVDGAAIDMLGAVQAVRDGPCPSTARAPPLQQQSVLNGAAQRWSRGGSIDEAVRDSGYRAEKVWGLHVTGSSAAAQALLRDRYCRPLHDKALRELGIYQRDGAAWLILASPFVPLAADDAAVLQRLLQLVNQARAAPRRCGTRDFVATRAVRVSVELQHVARDYAADMARRDFFAHVDPEGRTAADRVRGTVYRAALVGENLAVGPHSADEAIEGWLHSPGHCENLMDPRFTEVGQGYASARGSHSGEYWVQVFALPR